MKHLFLFLLLISFCGKSEPLEPKQEIGKWQVFFNDKPKNFGIEYLTFKDDGILKIEFDNNEDGVIDGEMEQAYKIEDYQGKPTIYLMFGANWYVWAYPQYRTENIGEIMDLQMLREATPNRIARYRKIN